MTSTSSNQDAVERIVKQILSVEKQRASVEGISATDAALVLRGLVGNRVGAFFHNTFPPGTVGICRVCRGPSEDGTCQRCADHASLHPDDLADRTILLTYAIDNRDGSQHQSAHHMRAYKGYSGTPRAPECSTDLQMMVSTTVEIHRPCFQAWLGAEWDSFTFVPSRERPDKTHPLVELANQVQPRITPARRMEKFALVPGPGSDTKHRLTENRFTVDPRWARHVEGKNVLIVDDTWTTGASAQGAAIAVKRAGAATATILCVDRWLRRDWNDHEKVINSLQDRYDVLKCPVNGLVCQPATLFQLYRPRP
ncbi:hypothetical protein [Nocardia gamkensis]|uniref:hypothetical protein n=1 Tax=Nocardia gamkensis TaxID=352869 RepID=UPI0037C5DD94